MIYKQLRNSTLKHVCIFIKKLEVQKESIKLVKQGYRFSKSFPDDEKYGLSSQIKRSAVSVVSNISEGTLRITNKDKAHFISIAFSSTMKLLNQLIIAKELKYI